MAVASIGTYSGPIGTTLLSILGGAQVWVKFINQKGGLNGHQVKLLVYDDGADPARHRAQAQDAVENQHVVAFFSCPEPFTGQAKVEYVNTKRIPVVGIGGGETWAYSSPMYFPQTATGEPFVRTWPFVTARYFVPKGKTRFGTLVCSEAPDCARAEEAFKKQEATEGYQHVYQGRTSIAQPDYTAECLAARNAGVEVLAVVMDQNSVGRVSSSCARQGYRPTFMIPAAVVADDMKKNPNLDGAIGLSNAFPYVATGTPTTDEFQEAMKAYGANLSKGVGPAVGWTSGKLLERAGAQLPEPPTAAALLQGLWSIKNDTLGGLTYPLTFVENQPARPVACSFKLVIENGSWVSPDGIKPICE